STSTCVLRHGISRPAPVAYDTTVMTATAVAARLLQAGTLDSRQRPRLRLRRRASPSRNAALAWTERRSERQRGHRTVHRDARAAPEAHPSPLPRPAGLYA